MTTSNPPPLLNYVLTTSPNPLQVSTNGKITVVASNPPPGTYGSATVAFPNNGYVGVQNIVFDFGLGGSGDASLSTASGSSWTVIPPANWTVAFSGTAFTFTPPGNGVVSPSDDLSFVFGEIPVNSTLGAVTLTITETAYTPGDPDNPNDYPGYPSSQPLPLPPTLPIYQTEWVQFLIGKFPQGFTPSFTANPVNVEVGGSTTLNWSGLPAGSHPEIGYPTSTQPISLIRHADGTLFQPNDFYPDISGKNPDPPFNLQTTTTFTLSGKCPLPGSSVPLPFYLPVTVNVSYPSPLIQFTASPTFFDFTSENLQQLALTWDVQHAPGETPVVLTVAPFLDDNEQSAPENAIFENARTARDSRIVKFDQPHVITLTAYGSAIPNTSNTTTRSIGIYQRPLIQSFSANPALASVTSQNTGPVALSWQANDTAGATPVTITVQPSLDPSEQAASGNSIFSNPQAASGSTVVQFDRPHLVTLTALGQGTGNTTSQSLAIVCSRQQPSVSLPSILIYAMTVTPDSRYALFIGDGSFTAITLDGSPAQWSLSTLGGSFTGANSIAVTPDGQYALVTCGGSSTIAVVTLTGAPDQWISTSITGNSLNGPLTIAVTPDGRYALVASQNNSCVTAISLTGSPAEWTFTPAAGVFATATAIAVTPDGLYALVNNLYGGVVSAIALNGAPDQWQSTTLAGTFNSPSIITLTPDGRYALVGNYGDDTITVITLAGSPNQWVSTSISTGCSNYKQISVSPDSGYALVGNSFAGPTVAAIALIGEPSQWAVTASVANITPSSMTMTPDGRFAIVLNSPATAAIEFSPPLGWRCLKSDPGAPPNDSNGVAWTSPNYNDLAWTAPVFQGALGTGPWSSSSFASRPLGPPPQWMWWTDTLAPGYPGDNDTVYFRFSFYWPDTSPRTLYISADNQYTAYFNGTQVAAGNSWGQPQTVSLTPVAGLNVVAVQAVNQGGPGGLIAQLA